MKKRSHDGTAKFLYDYLPLLVFFACYKFAKTPNPLITATFYMIITTSIAILISYLLTKKIPMIALASGAILGVFGGLTILLEDELFIKLKPTIINLLFATILFYGYLRKKPFLSYLLGEQIKMHNRAWLTLSARWAWFFVFLACLNEIVWRSCSTDFWVQFKVFGMMPISLIFTFSQLPFMLREMKKF
ncbi:MAG: septation protein A [Alphaproteobacteria bacterium]|nr:septation protein A [Alphaproteobacteria bacterium]